MTPDDSVKAMAARLSAIDWRRHGDKAWSRAALLKEYFRRVARWAQFYGCEAQTPFFDIAACVDPNVRADPEILDDLLTTVSPGGWDITHVTPLILHWAALRATPGIEFPADLEDPFEPLVQLFERGGGFHTENGEVNLEYIAAPMHRWLGFAAKPPMPTFAPEALDEIDRAGSIKQFGYVMGPDGKPVGRLP
ncbi:hypothetical protein BJ973_003389 [Actinoplanes tereljensis]|uniref:Uncharacterized protein n=1 Tax=Paractinoplanes tereljensis TaxID=571912 RepID=A0A919TYE9_9ACTN|nr:hypothetical protein [Actinoplanes tereljensis]GIF26119.1 hypothetical protein Ate02nite_88490 [Actinoplanes tereljensis]